MATIGMLLRRPSALPREMALRQRHRDAESFHRVSILLATLVAVGLLAPAFAIVAKLEPTSAFDLEPWRIPILVLSDSWWGLLPLAAGVWIGLRLVLTGYRWIGRLGAGAAFERQRALRLGHYLSGLAVMEAVLLALAYDGALIASLIPEHYPHAAALCPALNLFAAAAAIIGMAILWTTSLIFAIKIGRWKVLRSILLILAPAAALFVLVWAVVAASWGAGYLAIAIRSILG